MKTTQIFLAEDSRADVFLVREALSMHKVQHQLHVAGDGEEALRIVRRMGQPDQIPVPDLFLLDLNLPKLDGIAVLKSFRERPDCAATPVIVVTSSEMPREREQAMSLGVSRFFRKPANLAGFLQLGQVVKEVLDSASP